MKAACCLLVLGLSSAAVRAQELPTRDGREPMDFEPSLRLYDVKPEAGGKTVPWETPLPDEDKARTLADQAKRKADRWQQLQRKGVVSKVEAELANLQATRASLRYQQSHVAALKTRIVSLQERVAKKEASPDLLATAQADYAASAQLLAEAQALAARTDLQFAQDQVERQRKLVSAGIGSKSQLERAKANLVRAQATPAPQ
jgi:multidrug resistance efflux pump